MARFPRCRARERRRRTRPLSARAPDRQGAPLGGLSAVQRQHRLRQHHSGAAAGALPRRPRHGAAHPLVRPLERHGDGGAGQPASPPSSAGTSPASPPPPPCSTSASTISSGHADKDHGGDLVFFQGHSAPGIYARAFLEGRLSEEQLYNFRQEVDGNGLSSYPHPWLMPDFWQFPTVSMGLGPIMAIYQARFMRYLHDRGIVNTEGRKVWAFLGDGEMDEPESLGAISLAARERLDNLVFVVNCNLQRLDGPVRGNGKIIQELEARFPRRRLERHQGHLGQLLGPAVGARQPGPAAQAHGRVRRRRLPGLQGQGRRLHPRALLRQVPGARARWSPI